jgi:hypothetical protein
VADVRAGVQDRELGPDPREVVSDRKTSLAPANHDDVER